MAKRFGKGQVINHSKIPLLVIENDSGKPVAHLLVPKRKSPKSVDADGFRRVDGASILKHKGWWKIVNISTADIWQLGSDFLIPVSLAFPVSDGHFGKYRIDSSKLWGEELVYVTDIVRNKRGKVLGYRAEKFGRLSKPAAIKLALSGKLDNVVVVKNRR